VLINPSPAEIQALARIAQTPDGKVLLGFFGRPLERAQTSILNSEAPDVYRLQGRALQITDFRDALATAPDILASQTHRANGR